MARMYDSDYGRFLSVDPLAGMFPGWSPYNYVMGNPVGLTDMSGMCPECGGKDGKGSWLPDDANAATVVEHMGTTYVKKQRGANWFSWVAVEAVEITDNPKASIVQQVIPQVLEQFYWDNYGLLRPIKTGIETGGQAMGNVALELNPMTGIARMATGEEEVNLMNVGFAAFAFVPGGGAGKTVGKKALTEGTELAAKFGPEMASAIPTLFKSFTKSNYRYNLQVLTQSLGIGMDAHHIFPKAKKYMAFFERVGLNVHDPKYMAWWESVAHRAAAADYNKAWDAFMYANPKATLEQVENFGNALMKKYGF